MNDALNETASSFLWEVAQDVLATHSTHLKDTCFVFPNKLTLDAFQHVLCTAAQHSTKTIWLPLYSFDDFVALHTGYRIVDSFLLSTLLHKACLARSPPQEMTSFGDTIPWREAMLADFEVIDKEQVDAKSIFEAIALYKESQHTDFQHWQEAYYDVIRFFWEEDPSTYRRRTSEWSRLSYPLYMAYRRLLHRKGCAYRGMAYRTLAERVEAGYSFQKEVVFVGFHALNKSEYSIIRTCVAQHGARVYWDVDASYLLDGNHRAGDLLRGYKKDHVLGNTFPSVLPEHAKAPKDIVCIEATSLYAQARAVGAFLHEHVATSTAKTAIVLSKKEALQPLLLALPENTPAVQISLDDDSAQLLLFDVMRQWLEFWHAYTAGKGYPRRLLEAVLFHGVYGFLTAEKARYMENHARAGSGRSWWVQPNQFRDFKRTHDLLFAKEGENIVQRLLHSLRLLHQEAERVPTLFFNPFEEHVLRAVIERMQAQQGLFTEFFHTKDFQHVAHLLRQLLRTLPMPFKRNSAASIHILNLERSRNLDFHTVIFLDANEGKLPLPYRPLSLIPRHVGKGYGLPDQTTHYTLQTYFFYRLIQRARHIRFYYAQAGEGVGKDSGDVSRFVRQLEYLPAYARQIKEEKTAMPLIHLTPPPIAVPKDPSLMEKLRDYLCGKGLSFGAIDDYLTCSLRFYFKYLLKLRPQTAIWEDKNQSMHLGALLHNIMEELYKPYQGKNIDISTREQIRKAWKTMCLKSTFDKHYKSPKSVYVGVLRHMVEGILKQEEEATTPFRLCAVEKKVERQAEMVGERLRFSGKIDRIDKLEACTRITDYKTGKVPTDGKDVSVSSLFTRGHSTQRHFLQLMLYGWIYEKELQKEQDKGRIAARLLTAHHTINFEEGEHTMDIRKHSRAIEKALNEMVTTLLDEKIPFTQVEERAPCVHCDYRVVCNR